MFFYKKKILLYLITTCFAIAIKEISIVLIIPILFLLIKDNKLHALLKTLIFSIPLIIFFSIRLYFSEGALGLNIGHNGSIVNLKDILDNGFSSFYYLKEVHGASTENLLLFLIRAFIAVGFIYLIAFYLRLRFNLNSEYFIVTSLILFSVVLAVFLHASGVQRTIQIATPFLVFYSISVLEKLSLNNKLD